MFPSISPKQSFPALESEVLAYWKANNTFQKSIDSRPADNPYRFYDGPPFITGVPHYGNLLSSVVKDVVGRYWTMRGKRVDRVWGWDCHGLPIEEKVQKKLGLKSNKEIEEAGVKKFIDECYEYTKVTSDEWSWYIDKIGRWVDMDNAYRTMDQDYMESVMWVFSELWKKGLIYEGKRVSLYSWKLGTPISNFEVAMDDTYQEVNDPAITVKFELEKNDKFPAGTKVLAWTTTPWTIPANMALAVRNDIDYVHLALNPSPKGEGSGSDSSSLKEKGLGDEVESFIVAKNRAESVFKGKGEYTIIREFKGSELIGLGYVPPFPEYYYQQHGDKNHKIYHADFITDTDGTGIGHEAPEFGEVDFQLAKKEGIHISHAMDDAGRYSAEIFDFEGTHYLDLENPEKGANKINIERMKANNTLFKLEGITHRVPFCPRSNTPLMQKAQKSWFIDIQSQKDKLTRANEQINWFPEYLKEGRFKKGIETAPDWCISRTRYWGAPMPVWIGEDGERMVVSSREEIYEANKEYGQLEAREVDGKTVYYFKGGEYDGVEFNLHKPYIDSILLQNPKSIKSKKVLGVHGFRRTDSVVDFFAQTTKNLQEKGIEITCPLFEEGENVNYEKWKKIFLENIDGVDIIFAHSLGCRFSLDMIIKNKIPLKRLILVAPPEGKHERLQEFFLCLNEDISQIKNYVDEVVILYSTDDTEGRVEASKNMIEKTGGFAIQLNGYGHFNVAKSKLIEGLVQYGSPLTRIPEVLDVWMDSGSMPYAQMHYPFENKGAMEASFPADFIAEYVGQLRAWFYVMHVLGVLVNPNDKKEPTPSFTNVITTGVINGNDGRKMSKSFGNYPDPRLTIEKYGADPIRFYMLNSPLLSGGDMDFKEEQIIETVKGVMLPLWNTYSFFTTYANIDTWEPNKTEISYVRHGETDNNASGRMNGGDVDTPLNETGKNQAKEAGKKAKSQNVGYDIIISSPLSRAKDTARLIAEEIGYTGEIIIEKDFIEQSGGKFSGMLIADIMKEYDCKDVADARRIYRDQNGVENVEQFEARVLRGFKKIQEKYAGKKVLIAAHAGVYRPLERLFFDKTIEEEYFNNIASIPHAEIIRLPGTPLKNPLDQWILSKLQVLLGQVHDAMDGYDLSRACRSIVDYMDELTNWYVRLSRRRFWESGMTTDKESAYYTLHTVLVEVSKLLAPFMPFLSESIFQGLTKKESVHLQYVTFPNRHLISNELNRDMEICERIVSLGLALRSSKNIRVRQPLNSVTITKELSEYYQAIIRDELNVKEVKFENPEKLAKKICKPDARKIGPRFGKDVQFIIQQSKAGSFTEGENGRIVISANAGVQIPSSGGTKDPGAGNIDFSQAQNDEPNNSLFILESGEYSMEYIPLEGVGDVIGGYGMVVAMNTDITEELKIEGYARDIIRTIQDMRKEAGYEVSDRISITLGGNVSTVIKSKFSRMLESETLASLTENIVAPDLTREESLDEESNIQIAIKR